MQLTIDHNATTEQEAHLARWRFLFNQVRRPDLLRTGICRGVPKASLVQGKLDKERTATSWTHQELIDKTKVRCPFNLQCVVFFSEAKAHDMS
jgi:hypothetical protein